MTYDVCWKKLKGRKEMFKNIFKAGHWRLQVMVSTVCENIWFTTINLPKLHQTSFSYELCDNDLAEENSDMCDRNWEKFINGKVGFDFFYPT